jgi:lipoprotein-anchoring transpeptidase ErfK/SrfK
MRHLILSFMAFATMGVMSTQAAATDAPPSDPVAATEAAPATASAAATGDTATVAKAAPAKPAAPEITLTATINLTTQRMTVAYGGKTQQTWAISSGTREHASPVGSFKPQWQAKMWYSRKYDMAPMPHAVFFSGGVAVHATQATGRLGSPASHGCIRLSPANAAQFYALVSRHGNSHTRIIVNGRPNYNDDVASSRRSRNTQMASAEHRIIPRGYTQYSGGQPYFAQPQQQPRTYRSASYSAPTTRYYRY